MEIKQLEYFRAIVDAGTISGAARVLHMTQPPLSYQMKMLEEELQVQLFIRGSKQIRLTEAGKALYVRAESLLTMTDITKREVIKVSQATTIHLGMTPSTVDMMSEYLVKYTRRHPDIRFVIHDGSTFILKDQLENGLIDVTTLRTPITLNGFSSRLLAQEPLLAMVPRNMVKEGCRELSLKEIAAHHLILSKRYRKYVLSIFEKRGLSCDVYYECEDARTAMTLAGNGLGTAILPASMRYQSEKICPILIKEKELATDVLLVWRNEEISGPVEAFIREF